MRLLRKRGSRPYGTWMLAALAALLAVGCDRDSQLARHRQLLRAIRDEAVTKVATGLFAALIERRVDDAKAFMAPKLRAQIDPEPLVAGLRDLPSSTDHQLELIGYRKFSGSTGELANVTFQVHVSGRWAVGQAHMKRIDGKPLVTGFRLVPIPRPLEQEHALSLASAGPGHAWIVLCALLALGTSLLSAALCLRTPIPKRKWLWMLYVLVGFGAISLNWTTGELAVQLIHVQLLSFGAAQASPYDPWFVLVSFPGGALHFLSRRRHWLRAAQRAPANEPA